MKLTDLDPQWILWDAKGWTHEKNLRRVGVRFDCPHCKNTQICVLFLNSVDGHPSAPNDDKIPGNSGGNRWARSGLEFVDMSLSPRIDAPGHWHGFVTGGEVI